MSRHVDAAELTRVLAATGELGPYFAVGTGRVEEAGSGWRPLTDLYGDPALLRARVADVRERLGTGEDRVAASILFQGLAARLLSPAFGAAAGHGCVPHLPAAELHWCASAPGPLPLWLRQRPGQVAGWSVPDEPDQPAALARLIRGEVVEEHLVPLVAAVRRQVRVAERLLWGNVASALGGAAAMVAAARPDLAEDAAAVVTAAIELPPLAGGGSLVRPDARYPAYFFVRRTCCLYYRVPGGGMCGDCVLLDPERRRRQWERALATHAPDDHT